MNGEILDSHDRRYAIAELETYRDEMLEKLYQMKDLIQNLAGENRMIWERAKSYWHTSVENNLSSESGSFLGSMTNFSDTLKELKEHVACENSEEVDVEEN